MLLTIKSLSVSVCFSLHQTEIAKRLNTICAQVIPFLSQEVSMCDFELQTCFYAIYTLSLSLLALLIIRLFLWSFATWCLCVCVCFAASTAGGPSCRASQTGDHGRAKRCHRGTWTARSSTYRVYFLYFLFT